MIICFLFLLNGVSLKSKLGALDCGQGFSARAVRGEPFVRELPKMESVALFPRVC